MAIPARRLCRCSAAIAPLPGCCRLCLAWPLSPASASVPSVTHHCLPLGICSEARRSLQLCASPALHVPRPADGWHGETIGAQNNKGSGVACCLAGGYGEEDQLLPLQPHLSDLVCEHAQEIYSALREGPSEGPKSSVASTTLQQLLVMAKQTCCLHSAVPYSGADVTTEHKGS